MDPKLIQGATGCATLLRAAQFAQPLADAMAKWGVSTPVQQAAFLAQIGHESGGLARLEEGLSYSAERLCAVWPKRFPTLAAAAPYARNPRALANFVYGQRMGNTGPDDGWNFRGRGLKQLTGRDNYTAYSRAAGVDAVGNPDLLLEPRYAADSAGYFWHANKCGPLAEARDWAGLTKRINGGTVGLAERVSRTEKALALYGLSAR